MSDKYFFKGRQDARLNHADQSYQTKANHKAGSKKYPLKLIVTTQARKQEIAALVSKAGLFAEISLDSNDDAVESIAELTAQLNKGSTVRQDKTPSRNEPCSCGSGKKYKKCCG